MRLGMLSGDEIMCLSLLSEFNRIVGDHSCWPRETPLHFNIGKPSALIHVFHATQCLREVPTTTARITINLNFVLRGVDLRLMGRLGSIVTQANWFAPTLGSSECRTLRDKSFAHFSKMSRLQALNASKMTYITNESLRSLSGLSELVSLSLAGCTRLQEPECFTYIANLKSLQKLSVDRCFQLKGSGIRQLCGLSITELSLRGCIGLRGLSWATELKCVTSLYLGDCISLSSSDVSHLQRLPLQILDLSYCRFDQDVFARLAYVSSLRWLCLRGVRVTSPDAFGCLSSLSLRHLDVSYCDLEDDAMAKLVQGVIRNTLTSLNVTYSKRLSLKGVFYVTHFSVIERLVLDQCTFNASGAVDSFCAMPLLRVIGLCHTPGLSTYALARLRHNHPQKTNLHVVTFPSRTICGL